MTLARRDVRFFVNAVVPVETVRVLAKPLERREAGFSDHPIGTIDRLQNHADLRPQGDHSANFTGLSGKA
ncbi:MAG: hypothetical protein PGN25_04310 [Methylorubrum populi]